MQTNIHAARAIRIPNPVLEQLETQQPLASSKTLNYGNKVQACTLTVQCRLPRHLFISTSHLLSGVF